MFNPIDNKVIVRKVKEDEVTGGGFIIPESVQEETSIGIVEAVGPGVRSVTDPNLRGVMQVKKGDTIVLPKFAHKIEHNNEDFYIVSEPEIFTILN